MTQGIERRFFPLAAELEARADGEPAKVGGYGAVWYDGTPETEFELFPGVVERIDPDVEISLGNGDLISTFNHNPSQLLGRKSAGTLSTRRDKRGLRYTVTPPETQAGRDVLELVRRGDVVGSSIAFRIPRGGEKWRTDGDLEIRQISKLELFELGPVTEPAYSGTSAGIRAAGDLSEARESLDAHKAEVAAEAEAALEDLRRRSYRQRAAEVVEGL